VFEAVAAERQRQTEAQLAESERAIATGDREPWQPDLLRRIASMGVDVAALVERYWERTAGREIADPNAYLLTMAKDALAKRVGTTREVVAAVANDRAAMATAPDLGNTDRVVAARRDALAQRLGGGDIAAGYAALEMIPDRPHRKRALAEVGRSGGPPAPRPASDGPMPVGALAPGDGVPAGLGTSIRSRRVRP
jgi:hypothetical protein